MAGIDKKFQRRFLEVVKSLKDSKTLDELEALFIAGNIQEALVSAELAALSLGNMYGDAFVLAGNQTATVIGNSLEVIVNFDQVNTRALNAMQRNQLRLVREFTTEQARASRAAIIDGIEQGLNPRAMARNFRGSIGLTANQQQFVSNYRKNLEDLDGRALGRKLRDRRFDRTVNGAIRDGRSLSAAQIDTMVGRYESRWIKYRSEVIGRTEALRSVHDGTSEMYQQAIDSGTLNEQEVIRTWDTSQDDRVRDQHVSMNQQQRKVNEPFVSALGNQLMRPGDENAPAEETIQCRCALTTRFTDTAKRSVGGAATYLS